MPVHRTGGGLDEDDVRLRPTGSSRRRSRDRPDFSAAVSGFVVAVNRGRATCLTQDGVSVEAVRGADVRRQVVLVGDRVSLLGDLSGRDGTLARIVGIEPRRTLLRRTPDDTDPVERPVVANADLLVVVMALANPPPRTGLIDRCLVAAYDGGLTPLLCLTKRDLAAPDAAEQLAAPYRPIGVGIIAGGRGDELEPLRGELAGRTSVLFGHSGVGKSTLVNRLVPDAGRVTAEVNEVTGRGRHTSSSAVALPLPDGGWIIDTPGIRSFGLGLVSVERVLAAFPDLAAATENCPRGCTHLPDEPECGLDSTPGLAPERVRSLRRLLASREAGD